MRNYKAVFFDLDNTLFSFDEMYKTVSKKAMEHIMGQPATGPSFEDFYATFRRIADELYGEYEMGKRTMDSYRDERWMRSFHHYQIPFTSETLQELNQYIIANYLEYVKPYEGVTSILNNLKEQYPLGLITNGEVDMQLGKLLHMDIYQFFDPKLIIISEKCGISKPNPQIFFTALNEAGVQPSDALHIGDSLKHDIAGANGVGMDSALIHTPCKPGEIAPTYCFRNFFEAAHTLLHEGLE